jgi:hypothetical protein
LTEECFIEVTKELSEQFDKTLNTTQGNALCRWLGGFHDDDVRKAKDAIIQSENQKTFYLPATWKKYLPQQAQKAFRQNDEPTEGTYSLRYSTLAMKILNLQAARVIDEPYAQQMLKLALSDSVIEKVESEANQLKANWISEMRRRAAEEKFNEPVQIVASLGRK